MTKNFCIDRDPPPPLLKEYHKKATKKKLRASLIYLFIFYSPIDGAGLLPVEPLVDAGGAEGVLALGGQPGVLATFKFKSFVTFSGQKLANREKVCLRGS